MKKFFQTLLSFNTPEGKKSMTHTAAGIISVAALIIALPSMGVVGIPVGIITAAKVAVAIGIKLGISGMRNAQNPTLPVEEQK